MPRIPGRWDKFIWPRAIDGYEIDEFTSDPTDMNGAGLLSGAELGPIKRISRKSAAMKDEFPARDHKGLHRKFANLDETDEAVIGFVNEHGLLTADEAEGYDEFIERKRMVRAVTSVLMDGRRDIAIRVFNTSIGPLVREVIDDSNPNRPMPASAPVTLEGLIWLQVRDEILSGRKFIKCSWDECSEWYPVGPGTGSSEKRRKYCGDTCRSRAKRKRDRDSEEKQK